MQRIKIGIIGVGVVGGALARYLEADGYTINKYDPAQGFTDSVMDCSVVFICVPAETKGFEVDLTAVRESIARCHRSSLVVVRTTVPPGTCDKLTEEAGCTVAFMPEFLTERIADTDMARMDLTLGLPDRCRELTALAYVSLVRAVFASKRVGVSSAAEAEMAKYAHNVFGALKVTFFNGIYDLCQVEGLRYDRVLRTVLQSGYVDRTHTQVPGPDGQRGYGGKCFPKDVAAFIGYVKANPLHMLLKDILCLNRFYRGEKEYERTEEANGGVAAEASRGTGNSGADGESASEGLQQRAHAGPQ